MKKKRPIYSFRSGNHVAGVSADVVGTELGRIAKEGDLTPKAVVDSSRPVDAPLHPVFEWDDEVAAEKHREWQARHLIRSVQIQYDSQPVSAAFYHVTVDETPQYVPVQAVVTSKALLDSAIDCLRGKLESARHSLAELMQAQSQADQQSATAGVVQQHLEAAIEAAKVL